jgi:hypothetical protein
MRSMAGLFFGTARMPEDGHRRSKAALRGPALLVLMWSGGGGLATHLLLKNSEGRRFPLQ